MMSLIKNEFIKLLHRPIIYISIGLIVGCVLFIVIANYVTPSQNTQDYNPGMYDTDIEFYNNLKVSQNHNQEAIKEADRNLAIITLKIKYKIGYLDWRESILDTYFDLKDAEDPESQTTASKLLNFIKNNDFIEYCKYQLDSLKEQLKSVDKDSAEYKEISMNIEKNNMFIDYGITSEDERYGYVESYFFNLQEIDKINSSQDNSLSWSGDSLETLTRRNKILLYKIQNNLLESSTNKEARAINNCVTYSKVVTILLMIISAIVFVSEFSKKTITHLIMCPYGRNKIIFSKLFVIITTAIIFYLAYFGLSLLCSAILLPSGANTLNCIIMPEDTIINMPFYLYALMGIGFKFIIFLFYLSIVLLLAIFTKNMAATLSVSLVCAGYANSVIQMEYSLFKWNWLQYIPSVTCDFSQYTNVSYLAGNFNLICSILITVITIAVLCVLSILHFRRTEV